MKIENMDKFLEKLQLKNLTQKKQKIRIVLQSLKRLNP